MTWKIVGSLVAGILCGLVLNTPAPEVLNVVTDLALAVLLFAVGFSLGEDKDLWQKIRDLPKISLAVPFLIAIGSVCGAMLAGLAIRFSIGEAALVGAGFGWYSLSAVLIAQSYDVAVGALALLTNVFRELLAILFTPLVAKYLGRAPATAPGGATAMDVTLPIIAQSTDAQTALVAFYSGTVLSILVPFVVPLLVQLLQR
ncbi:LysO family transporter [Candidatus Darwinibacter acetoxidans]|nr:lysine exporter LysO family protein [Bacillota bacterium]